MHAYFIGTDICNSSDTTSAIYNQQSDLNHMILMQSLMLKQVQLRYFSLSEQAVTAHEWFHGYYMRNLIVREDVNFWHARYSLWEKKDSNGKCENIILCILNVPEIFFLFDFTSVSVSEVVPIICIFIIINPPRLQSHFYSLRSFLWIK